MTDLICPFSAPLAQEAYKCSHARKVIRRGGEEIACDNDSVHSSCKAVHDHCKQATLLQMGLEDDLLSVPHSSLVKIQFGTLMGLQQTMTHVDARYHEEEPDIPDLVTHAITHYSSVASIPTENTCNASMEFKLQRRRRK